MTATYFLNDDTRQPVAGWLNYPAGSDYPDPMRPMGPNTLGERLWPVVGERDETRTRVGFAYQPPQTIVEILRQMGAR